MKKKSTLNIILFIVLCISAVVFLIPIVFVLLNSFKGKLFISNDPFSLPDAETFAGLYFP